MAGAQTAVDEFAGIPKRAPATTAAVDDEFAGIPKLQLPDNSQGAANPDAPDEDVIVSNVKSAGRMIRAGVRGAVKTVQGFAAPIRRATGMPPATPPPEETTTAGTIGRGVEQAAELFIPQGIASSMAAKLGAANRLIKLGMGARAATLLGSLPEAVLQASGAKAWLSAQGADTHSSNVGAGLAAASPVIGAVAEVAGPMLREGARRGVEKVLATGLTDKMLRRAPGQSATVLTDATTDAMHGPLVQSWAKWEAATGAARKQAGEALERLLAGPAGDTALPKASVLGALDDLANTKGFSTVPIGGVQPNAGSIQQQAIRAGGLQQVQKDSALIKSISNLKAEINKYPGDYISARDWHFKKSLWDDTVYGGYTTGAVTPLQERLINANRKSALAAANGVRDLFTSSTALSVAAVDRVVSRAIRYNELVKEAAVQAEGASPALLRQFGHGVAGTLIGGGIGYETGGVKGAIAGALGGALTSQLNRVLSSPAWKLAPAATKRALADAIMTGRADAVRRVLAPLLTGAAVAPAPPGTGAATAIAQSPLPQTQ